MFPNNLSGVILQKTKDLKASQEAGNLHLEGRVHANTVSLAATQAFFKRE